MNDVAADTKAAQPDVVETVKAADDANAQSASADTEQAAIGNTEGEAGKIETEGTKPTEEKNQNGGSAKEHSEQPADSNMLRTKARINHEDYAVNSKYDANVLPESDDPTKIRTQVEFYFSDSNLPTDKFMWEMTGGQENKPVKLKKICSFGRMRRFKPYEAIVEALRQSTQLNVQGAEGEEELTRKEAYEPGKGSGKNDAATIYVKGFGDEEPSTQFDIEAFFTAFGNINAVRLRRTDSKLFKGSVYVEFEDEDSAKKFLELDRKPEWRGHELKIMSKRDYVEEKNELIRDGKIEPRSNSYSGRFYEGKMSRGRGRGRGDYGRSRDGDPNDWKKRREEDQKNGFRDDRNRRGGRGRGRGRGHWDNRRDNRRDDRQDTRAEPKLHSQDNDVKPVIHSSTESKDAASEEQPQVGEKASEAREKSPSKRGREDDGNSEQPPAKKVDTKVEVAADAS